MKKPSVFLYYVIATVLLVLLPAVLFVTVRLCMQNYEASQTENHLEVIRTQVLRCHNNAEGNWDEFMEKVSAFMSRNNELGTLMILDDDFNMVFPDNPRFQEARKPLARDFAEAIRLGSLTGNASFSASDGTSYSVNYSSLARDDPRLSHVIVYSDNARHSESLNRIALMAVLAAAVLCLLNVILLFFLSRSIWLPLRNLTAEMQRISQGSLEPIVASYPLREAEELRLAVNHSLSAVRQANDRQDALLGAANHHMRNQVLAIQGYAQGIETGIFSPPAEAAGKIRRECDAMSDLLLNFSIRSVIRDRTYYSNEHVYLSDVAEDCLSEHSAQAEQKNISLRLLPGGRNASALGSTELAEAVLGNLISNAVRYARKEVVVSVSETDRHIMVRVEDDGPDISEKDMENLFKPLYKGEGGVFGLGLSVAWDAAQCMGGTLSAGNRPEGGAVFTLTLPRAE